MHARLIIIPLCLAAPVLGGCVSEPVAGFHALALVYGTDDGGRVFVNLTGPAPAPLPDLTLVHLYKLTYEVEGSTLPAHTSWLDAAGAVVVVKDCPRDGEDCVERINWKGRGLPARGGFNLLALDLPGIATRNGTVVHYDDSVLGMHTGATWTGDYHYDGKAYPHRIELATGSLHLVDAVEGPPLEEVMFRLPSSPGDVPRSARTFFAGAQAPLWNGPAPVEAVTNISREFPDIDAALRSGCLLGYREDVPVESGVGPAGALPQRAHRYGLTIGGDLGGYWTVTAVHDLTLDQWSYYQSSPRVPREHACGGQRAPAGWTAQQFLVQAEADVAADHEILQYGFAWVPTSHWVAAEEQHFVLTRPPHETQSMLDFFTPGAYMRSALTGEHLASSPAGQVV